MHKLVHKSSGRVRLNANNIWTVFSLPFFNRLRANNLQTVEFFHIRLHPTGYYFFCDSYRPYYNDTRLEGNSVRLRKKGEGQKERETVIE